MYLGWYTNENGQELKGPRKAVSIQWKLKQIQTFWERTGVDERREN